MTAATDMPDTRLIWIDLEMTGLDTQRDAILEIATIVTDAHLNVLAEGPELAIAHPLATLHAAHAGTAPMDEARAALSPEHRRAVGVLETVRAALPGSPILYYGDEIGMGDDLALKERECARTPMQWTNEAHGGFTVSDRPVMPVIET